MARNRIAIDAPIGRVFATLSDPWTYSNWVVGTTEIVDADVAWPKAGARFSYRAGRFPLRWDGETEVIAAEPERRLVLRTRLPVGEVLIDIELFKVEDGTEVHMTESATNALGLPLDVAFHVRNAETLARLKAVVEGGPRLPLHAGSIPALVGTSYWLDRPGYAQVVASAAHCYLAIRTSSGPHVTPTAFTYSSGSIWIVTPRSSLKAKMLAKDDAVGVLIRDGDRSVVIGGRATVLDPMRLWMPRDLYERAHAMPALTGYLVDQRNRITGFLSGPALSLGQLNPASRVLISIAPERIDLVEREEILDETGGQSPETSFVPPDTDLSNERGPTIDLGDVPDSIAELAADERTPAALAIDAPSGPLALPAHWHPARSLASVPVALLGGLREGTVGLCLDGGDGTELDDQEGMLVRGEGRVVGTQRGFAAIAIDQDKTTMWRGAETATVES